MVELLSEMNLPSIIEPDGVYSVKESVMRELNADVLYEGNKDRKPEVPDKADSQLVADDDGITCLSRSLLAIYVEDLKKLSSNLRELNKNQEAVIETLQQENSRFVETLKMYNLDNIFLRAKFYSSKLLQIKKEMCIVHEKSLKLKKRALRLQQQKQKEALYKELQRDQELERDKQLAPKIVTKP